MAARIEGADLVADGLVGAATTLDFEIPLKDNYQKFGVYGGLYWYHAGVIDGHAEYDDDAPASGYITGITSGDQVAFNWSGKPLMVISPIGTFDFNSVELTAAWSKELTVKIIGYVDGEVAYHETVKLTDTGPTHVQLDWLNLSEVKIKTTKQIADPDQPHSGKQFALDDLVITSHSSAAPAATLTHAFVGDSIAHAHDALVFAHSQHAIAQITALV